MRRPLIHLALLAVATQASAQQMSLRQWFDPLGDATVKRTDPGADGDLNPDGTIPDLLHVSLAGWEPDDALVDPFEGSVVIGDDAHLLRITVTFRGLINPPGTLAFNGLDYDPFKFGPSPVYGSLDIDIDADRDTGGELGGAATQRYLANVARFGRVPTGELAERAARTHNDIDMVFDDGPQYERSGADLALAMCGCFETTIVSQDGDADGIFDEDETWIVRGRFLERTQGYQGASFMIGGSDLFLYDPIIDVRFQHISSSNTTTITLVFPLDMIGAAQMLGGDVQEMDNCIDECAPGGDHFSVAEAFNDVVIYLDNFTPSHPTDDLVINWKNRDVTNYLDPTDWRVTALFGMPYMEQEDAFYAWTDSGPLERHADLDGDGDADEDDEKLLIEGVYALDGTTADDDGAINGLVRIAIPGIHFNVLDLDGDHEIQMLDRYAYGDPADLTGDGIVDLLDFISFQSLVHLGDPNADFNLDQKIDVFDFIAFQSAASK